MWICASLVAGWNGKRLRQDRVETTSINVQAMAAESFANGGGRSVDICERLTCRICGSPDLQEIIHLGSQYLASRFPFSVASDQEPGPFPLVLVRCSEATGCGLVQLKHTVDPLLMYSEYGYLSGINEAMQGHLRSIVEVAESWVSLTDTSTVVDIGCNDGTLLNQYRFADKMMRIGFEPATNAAEIARSHGIRIEASFFGDEESVARMGGRQADVVTSIAMFYDLEDPQSFVDSVAAILATSGVWIVEMSYLPLMLRTKSLDTICHEHLEYYTIKQMDWMVSRSNMLILDATLNNTNGGSIQFVVGHEEYWSKHAFDATNVTRLRTQEESLDLGSSWPYTQFASDCEIVRSTLVHHVDRLRDDGAVVVGYGASTKGNTLLQYCGFDSEKIVYIADRNPWKDGRVTPGTRIPIVSEEAFRKDLPDFALVLPWHFIDGFVAREKQFLSNGGTFLVPLPELRLIREIANDS